MILERGNLRRVKVIDNGMYLSGCVINGECFMDRIAAQFSTHFALVSIPSVQSVRPSSLSLSLSFCPTAVDDFHVY